MPIRRSSRFTGPFRRINVPMPGREMTFLGHGGPRMPPGGTRTMRRGVVINLIAGSVACCVGHGIAQAETFPARPLTFVVPYAVGGTVDVQLRALAAATEKYLGQPFVMENRPSSTGTLGPSQMAATA